MVSDVLLGGAATSQPCVLGLKFDFVINDLTAIPVTHAVEGEAELPTLPLHYLIICGNKGSDWDFLKLVLGKAVAVLKADGKYITQGNSVNMPKALTQYESVIEGLTPSMTFSKVRPWTSFVCLRA
jgi:hypothetical protein